MEKNILDIEFPKNIHQKTPIYLGGMYEINLFKRYEILKLIFYSNFNKMVFIYVLQLTENKWYIGKTET